MTLPLRPGSDAFSKALLREQSIKDIVIRAVIGDGVAGDAYTLGSNEQVDRRRVDLLYLPLKKYARDLPPVVVEVQNKVSHSFIARAIRYCLNVFDETKSLPVLIVISAEGFSSKQFRDASFDISDNDPFFTHSCQSWAKQAQFYTTDSIAKQTDVSPMDPMIALCYFFMLQERSILALEKYDDPTIQAIYRKALEILSVEKDEKTSLTLQAQSFCDAVASQFTKILKCNQDQSETSKKRLRQYAEDGVRFAQQFKRQHLSTESESVTPIASENIDEPTADLLFVNNMKAQSSGRFKWTACYDQGKLEGRFTRY
ncbi:hypothetical protein DFQ28_003345, partial [Apophysomyces sp. BC1034]